MNLAMDYAFENRARMLEKTCTIVRELIERHTEYTVEFGEEVNCHHNYAALENHYDANVWVHRKGAVRVREGEKAVIPGAMGSYSYVVEGKGNKESFLHILSRRGKKLFEKRRDAGFYGGKSYGGSEGARRRARKTKEK